MIYADTNFFLALLKPQDWLKKRAKEILRTYSGEITTSLTTFIELMLLVKRYDLDPVRVTASVMAICGIEDERPLKAALYIRDYGLGVFDAFHAAHAGDRIISSDEVYDRIGLSRVKLEE